MSFDLVSSLVAYMRTNSDLVAAFNDSPSNPSFWSNYNALQSSATDPIMPYLVFVEPQETKNYETADYTENPSDQATGVLMADIYAPNEANLRALGEQVCGVLNDCDDVIDGLFYFRRTTQSFPPTPQTGPDASPTIFQRSIQFRYMYEEYLA